MRILVTADVHLSANHPERQEALEDLIRIGVEEDIDYLLIAGDMFDAGVDVDEMKTGIRDLFSDNGFQTFVIPGNHDEDAFRDEDYFGEDIEVLSEQPFTQVDLGEVNLLAMPFVDGNFGEYVDDVYAARNEETLNVLMLHGTLSTTTGKVFGEESRYLPFTPEQLLETGADYVFAGHIHSSPTKRSFGGDECAFAYPGSPVSITTKETDRRGVWLFDTDDNELRERVVESHYYVPEELDLSPGEAEAKLEELQDRLTDQDLENATLLVEPAGFIEMDAGTFFEQLEEIIEDAGAEEYRIRRDGVESAKTILDTGLYRGFEGRLEEAELKVDKREVRWIALQALSAEERG